MLVKFLSAVSVVALLSSPVMAGEKKKAAKKSACKAGETWNKAAKKCEAAKVEEAKAEETAPSTAPAEAPAEAPIGE